MPTETMLNSPDEFCRVKKITTAHLQSLVEAADEALAAFHDAVRDVEKYIGCDLDELGIDEDRKLVHLSADTLIARAMKHERTLAKEPNDFPDDVPF